MNRRKGAVDRFGYTLVEMLVATTLTLMMMFVVVRLFAQIGEGVSIGAQSIVGGHVTIGDGVLIESGVFIADHSILEEGCRIGPNVVLANAQHPDQSADSVGLPGPTVGSKARIGANATILPGITVGSGALVAAGALVVEDVPEGGLVAGNPARLVDHTSELAASEIAYLMGR